MFPGWGTPSVPSSGKHLSIGSLGPKTDWEAGRLWAVWGGPQPSLCEEPEAPSPRVSPLPTPGGPLAVDGLHTGALGVQGVLVGPGAPGDGLGEM